MAVARWLELCYVEEKESCFLLSLATKCQLPDLNFWFLDFKFDGNSLIPFIDDLGLYLKIFHVLHSIHYLWILNWPSKALERVLFFSGGWAKSLFSSLEIMGRIASGLGYLTCQVLFLMCWFYLPSYWEQYLFAIMVSQQCLFFPVMSFHSIAFKDCVCVHARILKCSCLS